MLLLCRATFDPLVKPRPHGLFTQDPAFWCTVHLGGDGYEEQLAQQAAAAKAAWADRVVVKDKAAHFHGLPGTGDKASAQVTGWGGSSGASGCCCCISSCWCCHMTALLVLSEPPPPSFAHTTAAALMGIVQQCTRRLSTCHAYARNKQAGEPALYQPGTTWLTGLAMGSV